MDESVIRMRGISKVFGTNKANDSIDMDVYKGEILALLGENGAGKSTLMKILFGLYARDEGTVEISGTPMPAVYSPKTAMEAGLAMVHQHFKLVESFPVAENIVLGCEEKISKFIYSREKTRKKIDELFDFAGFSIPKDAIVKDLPLGDRQRVEILKALYRGCRVLILDEPTTVLTPQETDELFALLRRLKERGMTIIIITHKLKEVLAISDRVLVLRQGKLIREFITRETDASELACTMVGYELQNSTVTPLPCGNLQPEIELKDISTEGEQGCNLKGLNLRLYPGRIVGIAGVDGNGQSELVKVLAGIGIPVSGKLSIRGQETAFGKDTLRTSGVRIIPEDRHRQGLVLPLSVQDNIMLGYRNNGKFRKGIMFRYKDVCRFSDEMIEKFDIRPKSRTQIARFMSGGNQQKVVLARELSQSNLRTVVASQPTRGLDVGAIEFTHEQLIAHRDAGEAVLLISSDLDEIMALSDEIAVIYGGKIAVQKYSGELDRQKLGIYMGGGVPKEAE